MSEIFSDILTSLSKNKLRTILTGSSMAWGVFILIVLLGCGNGLKNAVMYNYADSAVNTITIWPGFTTMPYNGLSTGRRTILDDKVIRAMREEFPQISAAAPLRTVWNVTKTVGDEYIQGGILGITPEWLEIEHCNVVKGRLLNKMDNEGKRKVMVIHRKNAELLFKGSEALGRYITVNMVPYKVVGVYDSNNGSQNTPDLIPLQTLEMVYPSRNGYERVTIAVDGVTSFKKSGKFEEKLRAMLASRLQCSVKDEGALWIWNNMSSYMEVQGIFRGISIFLWLIGIGTLIAGIVGIGNIMLVTVKERTKEFGIRKALGARPRSIMKLILTESLLITTSFGYLGMLAGILLIEALAKAFPAPDPSVSEITSTAFVNPCVNLGTALGALGILIAAGVLAAMVPARKALEVKPIEALHYDD